MRTSHQKVSVIIPVYNGRNYLERAVGSVLAQSFEASEILLIDDYSTDDSFALAQKLSSCPNIFAYHNAGPKGQGFCRNLGLQKAQGDYIAFLDCDDFWEDSFLEQLSVCLQAHAVDFVACGYDKLSDVDFFGSYLPPAGLQKGGKSFLPLLMQTELLVWNKLYRRSFLLNHQLQHRLAACGEDWLFCLECYCAATTYYNLPQPLYYYYQHKASFTHLPFNDSDINFIFNFLDALDNFFLEHDELVASEKQLISQQMVFSLCSCYLRPIYSALPATTQDKLLKRLLRYGTLDLSLLDACR